MPKLYYHYKNKPYKYLGLAKHSETLEEMVIYETLYENPNGKIWVRPKEMFFETVEVQKKTSPRFRAVQPEIKSYTTVTDTEVSLLAPLIEKAFGEWDSKWFYSKFNSHKKFYLAIAYLDGKPAAFKLGYELDAIKFYSWLGGVVPEFRGLGLATALMADQHQWCIREGYKVIQTKTQNRFREMLLLNINQGFEIIGIQDSDEGGSKIILEKKLKV